MYRKPEAIKRSSLSGRRQLRIMCGISGIIAADGVPVSEQEIMHMGLMVAHRGPDAEGHFTRKNLALGHRRLKIIDISNAANQPFHYMNDKYVIVYNGEVYNYIELKEELTKSGYHFSTASDTEVILASYDQWGFRCVEKFNGMWSFAIYDAARNIVFCSRDRFGEKPFYYTQTRGKFVFGSEIKQLLLFYSKPKVNISILLDYLVCGFEDHVSETFFENIYKLNPGHNLIYDLESGTFTTQRYYELKINRDFKELTFGEAVNAYRVTLEDAVRIRLRSDVRVGTCLSGGTDSSAVASIAAAFHKGSNGFAAITARSAEQKTDESGYARLVVEHARLDWHVTESPVADFIEQIDRVIDSQEEPFGSPSIFMQERVFRKAKEIGCTVMLDGQGGDETLLGYERYYPAYVMSKLGVKNKLSGLLSAWRNSRLSMNEAAMYMIYFTQPALRMAVLRRRLGFIKKEYLKYLGKKHIDESAASYGDIDKLQLLEIESLQLPHLLRYEDKNSMRYGIESRLPFLDYRLVELSVSLNNEYKIKDGWTKYILRKATENILPPEIAWRKNKLGFNAPEKLWMGGIEEKIYNSVGQSAILNRIAQRDMMLKKLPSLDLRIKWKLFNIARWEELYGVHV